jgi:hypothetical protein
MLLAVIALVYTVISAYTLIMCFENTTCFYGVFIGSALLALLVEHVVKFIISTTSASNLSLEEYASKTIAVDERQYQRFKMIYDHELVAHSVTVVSAQTKEHILKNGQIASVMVFEKIVAPT